MYNKHINPLQQQQYAQQRQNIHRGKSLFMDGAHMSRAVRALTHQVDS